MKYVALLRGINVGGKNRVGMKQLAGAMEQAGFTHVSTYINSGNIIFSSSQHSITALQNKVEAIITTEFALKIKALVLNQSSFNAIAEAIPINWTNYNTMKCDVMFLWEKYTAAEVIPLFPVKPDIDTVIAVPGAVIWGIERSKATKSGLPKIIGTDIYAHMTIRNCNTVRKLQILIND